MSKGLSAMRFTALTVALLLLAPAVGFLAAGEEASPDVTMKGEILDMACYLAHEAKGPDHMKCAQRCAQMGQPIGFLSDQGKVYLLVADHGDQSAFEQAKTLAGQMATITGAVAGRGGIESLTVHAVAKG